MLKLALRYHIWRYSTTQNTRSALRIMELRQLHTDREEGWA